MELKTGKKILGTFVPFFVLLIFFTYLCGMKNGYKVGKVLRDKKIKFINKVLKTTEFDFDAKFYNESDVYGILDGSIMKVKVVRKYNHYYDWKQENNRFCYEVDVIVDVTNTKQRGVFFGFYNYRKRSLNQRMRWRLENIFRRELSYFGITNLDSITISKIEYNY